MIKSIQSTITGKRFTFRKMFVKESVNYNAG